MNNYTHILMIMGHIDGDTNQFDSNVLNLFYRYAHGFW